MDEEAASPEESTRPDAEALTRLADALGNTVPVESRVGETDWNFAKCPKSQLPFCQMYEYGRSCPQTIAKVRRWREQNFAEADQPVTDNRQLKAREPMDFFRLFPEFPKTPWLELDPAVRQSRLKALPKRKRFLVRSVPVESLKVQGKYRDIVEVVKPYETGTIQPLEVTWFYNGKELIASFKDWLKQHRPYRAREERGRTEPRVLLNALAAKRLLTHHTVPECLDITGEVLGKPLFGVDSDWLDARQRADDHLAGRLPALPIERLYKKLPKDEFTEAEINRLWQYWVGLKVAEARALYLLSTEKFVAKMQAVLKKVAPT